MAWEAAFCNVVLVSTLAKLQVSVKKFVMSELKQAIGSTMNKASVYKFVKYQKNIRYGRAIAFIERVVCAEKEVSQMVAAGVR